mgnify:CR=1 FL=1
MNLIELSIKRPVAVMAAVIAVVMFGILALTKIPIQLTPDVRKPVISLRTVWPGAAPAEIEREGMRLGIMYAEHGAHHQPHSASHAITVAKQVDIIGDDHLVEVGAHAFDKLERAVDVEVAAPAHLEKSLD